MDEHKTRAFPVTLFYVYAHTDEKLRQKLEKHLSLLLQQGLINAWHDRQIVPGTNWKQAIDNHLNMASVILLLISPDFMASDYCYGAEMLQALARHEKGNAHVIPILLRPVDWESALFSSLQILPRNAKPVTAWSSQDAAFVDITKGIRRVIEAFIPTSSTMHSRASHRDLQWNTYQSDVIARIKYLKHMEERYAFITLPQGPVEGLSLRAVFQPLTLRRDPVTAEDRQYEERRHLLGEPEQFKNEPGMIAQNGEDALAKSPQNRIVVLGGPGTGKTTLLQSLISERTQQALIDLTASLPVLLSLPDLARSGKTLPEYLARLMKETGISDLSTNLLWRTIEEGHAFVCLDSLDEVTPRERPEMIRLINELAARSGNIWVIGSRFTEYKGGQFKRGQFAEWELLPLDYEMRQHFARQLLPELYRLLPGIDSSVVHEPAVLVQNLERHQHAASWGENPLLFSLAATVFVRTGTLPTSLAALYQQVIVAVLEMREPDPTRWKLLQQVVAGLALELYQIKGRTFTRDDIVTLMPVIRQRQHENWSTEEMVNRIVASGLLDIVAQETYSFRHQTFQEYLAAAELAQQLMNRQQEVREEGWSFAWGKRTYSRWTEILRLMVGILVQKHRREGAQLARRWLLALARQQRETDDDIGNLGLTLALESLTEISEMKTGSWKEAHGEEVEAEVITSWITALFGVRGGKGQVQQERLRRLGQYVNQLGEAAVKLAVEQLSTKLTAHEGQVRQIAVQALEVIGPNHIPLGPLLDLLHDKNSGVRGAVVQLLGNQGEQGPVDALLDAFSDEDYFVRQVAETMLVNRRKLAPVPQLMQLLQADNWHTRASAARVLAQLGISVSAEPFLADLNESKGERRWEAVHVLEKLGADAPIEPLLAALGDEEMNVRTAAAYALGELKEYVPIERLIVALNDTNRDIRIAALEALERREDNTRMVFGPTATSSFHSIDPTTNDEERNIPGDPKAQTPVEPLLKMLRDKDQFVRSQAAQVLEKLGERVPVEPLVAALDDEYEFVRHSVVKALGNVRVGVPTEPLLKALCDESSYVRQAAAETLVKMGVHPSEEFFLTDIVHHLMWMRTTALQVLSSVREHVPIEVFENLLYDEDAGMRAKAAEALGQFGDHAPVEPLLVALQDRDVQVRMAAAKALGKLGERVPLEPLLRALNDEMLQVREEVARTLGEIGDRVPLEPFLEALSDERTSMRAAAADVLGELGTRTPLEPLLLALSDPDPSVRSMVVWALGEQGERTPIETLVTALKDEDASVRCWAVWALGKLGSRAPIEPLLAALQDESGEVQSNVIWALQELAEYVPLETLLALVDNDDRKIRGAMWRVLESLGQPLPAERVVHALNDADKQVRVAAIKVIGKLDESIQAEHLLDLLGDEDWDIILAAKSTLSKLVESVPIELLLETLRSKQSNVRTATVELLGLLKGQTVVDTLLALLHVDDQHITMPAVKALGSLGILSPVERLFPILYEGQQPERYKAAKTLGELGDHIPIEPLLAAIDDEDGLVRETVVKALGNLKEQLPFEPLVAALGDSEQRVREAAIKALCKTHSEALLVVMPDAIAILQGGEPEKVLASMVQGVVADAIGNTGSNSPALLYKLTQLLDKPYWEVRMKAAQALGKLRRNIPDAAIRRLLELRHDPQSRTVRVAANEALTEILSLETGIEDD